VFVCGEVLGVLERRDLLYAAAVLLAALDVGVALHVVYRGAFPLRVNLGTPTAYFNIYLHIPMAWATYVLYTGGFVSAILYLVRGNERWDRYTRAFIALGTVYAVFTLASGMAWASESWGAAWSWDPRETGVLLLLLAYLVYFALRSSIPDPDRAASLSAAYAVAAYSMVPVSFIAPRLAQSLHPTMGNFGNFMGRPDVLGIFVPRVVLATIVALLLANLYARRLAGEPAPSWLRPVAAGFIVGGLVIGLVVASPYLRGGVERVVGAKLDSSDRIVSLTLIGPEGNHTVEFREPVPSPVQPPVYEGKPTILSHLVRVEDGRVEVVRHWSVALNAAAYPVILGIAFWLLSRRGRESPGEG
jgi:heme exporter protein C